MLSMTAPVLSDPNRNVMTTLKRLNAALLTASLLAMPAADAATMTKADDQAGKARPVAAAKTKFGKS
jgi:hypothetical protein